jgi:hypothetical protein
VRAVSVAWKLNIVEEWCQDQTVSFDDEITGTNTTNLKNYPGFVS